jgi:type II secretion system protein H
MTVHQPTRIKREARPCGGRLRGRRRAFSLLELVLVLVIMGIAAAIAVPRHAAALARYRAETCARRIAADLEQARDVARQTSGDQTILFNPAAECYTLTGRDDPDRPGQPYTVALAGDPYHADLVGATFGAGAAVTFNGFGLPQDGGTVTVESGGYAWTVMVDGESGEVTTSGP